MKSGSWKCFLYCFLFVFFICNATYAQDDPIRDSLKILVRKAKGNDRVDRMLELCIHENGEKRHQNCLNIAQNALALAKKLDYGHGVAMSYNRLALSLDMLGKNNEAEDSYFKSFEIYRGLSDSTGMIYALTYLSEHNLRCNDCSQAIYYADKAFDIAGKMRDAIRLKDILFLYSRIYNQQGLTGKEETIYEKLLSHYATVNWNAADLYLLLGRFYVNHGNYARGIVYFRKTDSALIVRESMDGMDHRNRGFLRAKQTGNIARAYRLWGYYDSAMFYHRRSIQEMFRYSPENPADVANQMEGIAIVYSQWGVFDSARYYFQQSINLRTSDPLGIGFCFDGLGYISWLLGDYETASGYFLKALTEKSKYKPLISQTNRIFTLKEGLSISHLRLGMVYADWDYWETALEEFNKSLNLCREIGFNSGETDALLEIGKLYMHLDNYREAHRYFRKAYENSKLAGDDPAQTLVLKNMGNLLVKERDFSGGMELFRRSEKIGKKVGNPVEMADIYLCIGKTLCLMGLHAEGEKELLKSLNQAEKLRIDKLIMECHDMLAKVYEKTDMTKMALSHLQRGSNIRDSLFSRKTALFLADINENNEASKLQLQVDLLQQSKKLKDAEFRDERNRLAGLAGLGILLIVLAYIFTQNNRMQRKYDALKLQQRLFRARLNPVFIVSSLNDIKGFIEKSESGRAVNYLSYFARYVQYVLHGSRKEFVTVGQEIAMIESFLNLKKSVFGDRFDFFVNVEPGFDPEDDRIVPLFIQPELEKAIERAVNGQSFPGILKISVKEGKSAVMFLIEDNGRAESGLRQFNEQELWNKVELEIPYFSPTTETGILAKYFMKMNLLFLLIYTPITGNSTFLSAQDAYFRMDSAVKVYHKLFEENEQKGNYVNALNYFKLYNIAKDSLDRLNRENDLKTLEMKYQNDTKAQQIILINNEKAFREIKFRQLRYSVFGLTGILLIGFILVLLIFNRSRLRMNQQALDTEQYLLRAQMNPHFIFNALTNIQALIQQGVNDAAMRYLGLFADLTGKILENSGNESVKLADEVSVIRNYILLQILRYGNKFEFNFTMDDEEEIGETPIPPMLIQPFVENAVEHGLKYKEGNGLLELRIFKNKADGIIIEIEDNGIGRKKSGEIHNRQEDKHQGLATTITRERIERINKDQKKKISMEITDINAENGNAAGTLVRFTFPNN